MVLNAVNPFVTQPQQSLGSMNEATLMALAQQGNPNFTHAALLEQAAAPQPMQKVASENNTERQKEKLYPERQTNTKKAKKKTQLLFHLGLLMTHRRGQ